MYAIRSYYAELLKVFASCTHSRLPVYRESLDDPIGFVHIKDIVSELAKGGEPPKRPLERLHREVLYVPPSMKLTDLLVKMQSTRIRITSYNVCYTKLLRIPAAWSVS